MDSYYAAEWCRYDATCVKMCEILSPDVLAMSHCITSYNKRGIQ